MATMGGTTSLWLTRLLLFVMGMGVGQVIIGGQAISFATISPADTGRASTLYNALRQLAGAVGIALLTTVLVGVGPIHLVAGTRSGQLRRLSGHVPGGCGDVPRRGALVAGHS